MIQITIERYNELVKAELSCKILLDIIGDETDSFQKLDNLKIVRNAILPQERRCQIGIPKDKDPFGEGE